MSKEKNCNLNRIYLFFPKQCTGWVLFAYLQCPVGWCVRLPEISFPLVSHCLPTCVPVLMVRPPSRGLVSPCLPLSACSCLPTCVPVRCCVRLPAVLPPLVSHCLHTCVPVLDGASAFPRSCLCLSPIVSPHVCLCWLVRPPSRRLVFPCVG